MLLEYQKNDLIISTDQSKLDFNFIHNHLNKTYWAKGIPMEIVKKSVENSIAYGVYQQEKQIGFARLITDKATFAYLADVLISDGFRGNGFAKWLMDCIIKNPEIQGLRLFLLATQDAHTLYQQFGFKPVAEPKRFMEIFKPDIYQQKE
jgi:N-acetylglutamate synthase-like GNAT family acetyltransferase